MNIPNIPTDNLYKYVAISGVVIVLLSIYLFNSSIIELQKNMNSTKEKQEIWLVKQILLKLDYKISDSNIINRDHEKYLDEKVKHIKIGTEINNEKVVLQSLYLYYIYMCIGFLIMIIGFCLWYIRLQRPLDKILKNKVLKSQQSTNPSSINTNKQIKNKSINE